MNKIIVGTFIVLFVLLLGYFIYEQVISGVVDNLRTLSYNQGIAFWNQEVINQLQSTNEVPIIINTNGSLSVETYTCNGG